MDEQSPESQFHLLRSRRFAPLFLTLFLGAFNDNVFKNSLLVLVVTVGFAVSGANHHMLVNLAAAVFILPYFLFSPLAGQLADKYEKSLLIRRIKLAEIVIMTVGAVALVFHYFGGLLLVLFAMGTQSAFFGPLKYSILPQHLRPDELVGGNALAEMGTFVAILLGTLMGTMLAGTPHPVITIGAAIVSTALLGWLVSRSVPIAMPQAPDLKIDWNPFTEMIQLVGLAREKTAVWYAVLGISWFWLLGSAYLTQTPAFAVDVLGGQASLIALLLCAFTLGIGIGTLLCDRLSGQKVEIGLAPLGSLGLSLFGLDLYFSSAAYVVVPEVGLGVFLSHWQSLRIVLDMMLIGLFGGLFIVPLNTLIQARTPGDKRARVIACNNIINALFMVLASVLGLIFLGVSGYTIPQFFLVLTVMNLVVALFIFGQVPEFTMRFLVWLLSHSMYRVSHDGLGHIPGRGGALLVCNHVSYVDAPILAGAIRRPVRFVMYKPIYSIPVLHFIFKTGGAIPICSKQEDEKVYNQAMATIAQALGNGELLCLFPEGKLTRDGDIDEFKRGVERIVAETPVPVIPLAIRGLWGSFFSHKGGVFRSGWKLFSPIDVVAGFPVPAEQVSAAALQQQVTELRGNKP